MGITDPSLKRAIHNATGMSNAEIETDPAEYVHRFVEAGLSIIDLRRRLAGDAPGPSVDKSRVCRSPR